MTTAKQAEAKHEQMKLIRGRGDLRQHHLASLAYLRELEREMDRIRELLNIAWVHLEGVHDFRKCSRHMDHAQQRMHRVIKRIGALKLKGAAG